MTFDLWDILVPFPLERWDEMTEKLAADLNGASSQAGTLRTADLLDVFGCGRSGKPSCGAEVAVQRAAESVIDDGSSTVV